MTKEAAPDPNGPGLKRIMRAAIRHDFPVNIPCWENLDTGTALTDHLSDSERAMLMGGACAKAYGWSPQKG